MALFPVPLSKSAVRAGPFNHPTPAERWQVSYLKCPSFHRFKILFLPCRQDMLLDTHPFFPEERGFPRTRHKCGGAFETPETHIRGEKEHESCSPPSSLVVLSSLQSVVTFLSGSPLLLKCSSFLGLLTVHLFSCPPKQEFIYVTCFLFQKYFNCIYPK